jgi:hypothetical protein
MPCSAVGRNRRTWGQLPCPTTCPTKRHARSRKLEERSRKPARLHTAERYRSGRNGGASKASCRVSGTWVRIPPSPPNSLRSFGGAGWLQASSDSRSARRSRRESHPLRHYKLLKTSVLSDPIFRLYLTPRFRPTFRLQNARKQAHFGHAGSDSTLSVAKFSATLLHSGFGALKFRCAERRTAGRRRFAKRKPASRQPSIFLVNPSLPFTSSIKRFGWH